MENKTTTELLNALANLKEGDWVSGGKYEQLIGELVTREPFTTILDKDYDESIPAAWEAINDLKEEIKKLRRHKHDPATGDVMVRV